MKQAEKSFLISDAAKQVQVESHVLRYWEEELKLPIKRNEMGHRYYTQEDIARFKEIRNLKEQGLQLKAIRNLLQKGKFGANGDIYDAIKTDTENEAASGFADRNPGEESMKRHVVMVNKGEFVPITEESREAKSLRLQQLLQNMIVEAVRSNNKEVCEEIKESMLKELDYQFRLQEEREDEREGVRIDRQEEYYRQMDELIRTRGKGRKKKKDIPDKDKKKAEKEILQSSMEWENGTKKKGFFARKKRSVK